MCVVMNLERRMDRRRWMELMCANALRALAPEVEFLCATEQNELRIEDDTVASARDFARSAPLSKTRSNRCRMRPTQFRKVSSWGQARTDVVGRGHAGFTLRP